MYRTALLAFVVSIAACGERPQQPSRLDTQTAHDSSWTVSLRGIGPIVAGMPYRSMMDAIGAPAPTSASAVDECRFTRIPGNPALRGVAIMVVHDTVVRVDVDSGSVATTWGDHIGEPEPAVLARHVGGIRVEPHKYTGPEGHYLVLTDAADTLHRAVFETDGKRVLRYRAGRRPEVEWVEGCS